MAMIEIDAKSVLAAEAAIPKGIPIVMLNLLRYREKADYGGRTDVAPCSGREAYYERYVPAYNKVTAEMKGIQLFWLGAVQALVVGGPDERWDDVALVEYPSFAAFQQVIDSPMYKAEADHHRLAALEDWKLIATVKTALA